jgi:hypothetical protein
VEDLKFIAMCDDDTKRTAMLSTFTGNLSKSDTFELFRNKVTRTLIRLRGRLNGLSDCEPVDLDDVLLLKEIGGLSLDKVIKLMLHSSKIIKFPRDLGFSGQQASMYTNYLMWLQPENFSVEEISNSCLLTTLPQYLIDDGYLPKDCSRLHTSTLLPNIDALSTCSGFEERLSQLEWLDVLGHPCLVNNKFTKIGLYVIPYIRSKFNVADHILVAISNYEVLSSLSNPATFAAEYLDAITERKLVSGLVNVPATEANLCYLMTRNKTLFKKLAEKF